jgi:hypothetical protein
MSTAYHPQTDGQSERTNQTLETFLRIFCNHQQNDWAKLLPVAQYALNARRSATTKKAPFKALIGYIPSVHQHAAITRFQNIEDRLSAIKVIRREAQSHIKYAQDLLIKTNTFKPYTLGQRVWLEATNLRTTHPTAKLRPKRYGPFTITRVISHGRISSIFLHNGRYTMSFTLHTYRHIRKRRNTVRTSRNLHLI